MCLKGFTVVGKLSCSLTSSTFLLASSEATCAAMSTVSCLCVYLGGCTTGSSFFLGSGLGSFFLPGVGERGVPCLMASIHMSLSSLEAAFSR